MAIHVVNKEFQWQCDVHLSDWVDIHWMRSCDILTQQMSDFLMMRMNVNVHLSDWVDIHWTRSSDILMQKMSDVLMMWTNVNAMWAWVSIENIVQKREKKHLLTCAIKTIVFWDTKVKFDFYLYCGWECLTENSFLCAKDAFCPFLFGAQTSWWRHKNSTKNTVRNERWGAKKNYFL